MDQLATEGRELGMNWSSGSIGAIERGLFKPTLDVLAALADSLGSLHDEDGPAVPVRELLETNALIRVSGSAVASTGGLTTWLAGGELDLQLDPAEIAEIRQAFAQKIERLKSLHLPDITRGDLRKMGSVTAGEKRLAKKISVDPLELQAWSFHLWGMSIEEKRDQDAGPDSTPQRKGRVSRDLLQEIEAAMKDTRGHD